MEIIGVTGGIGSGKSVVCRFLRILGYSVYDSDERAKVLMDSSASIKSALVAEFGADVCIDGVWDRRRLAEIVFADALYFNHGLHIGIVFVEQSHRLFECGEP